MRELNYITLEPLLEPECGTAYNVFLKLVSKHLSEDSEIFQKFPTPQFNLFGKRKTTEEAIAYFKKIVEHKIAVFESGIELLEKYEIEDKERFIENLAKHDMSKFSWEEFNGYLNWDFKTRSGDEEGFEKAWVNHKRVNPHHPEYWFTVNRSGVSKVLAMPEVYVMEMVADWIGAGKTYGSGLDVWLPANLHTFVFHQDTAIILQKILNSLGFVTDHTDTGLKVI